MESIKNATNRQEIIRKVCINIYGASRSVDMDRKERECGSPEMEQRGEVNVQRK